MPTYNVKFYDVSPAANGFTTSGSFTYTGSGNQVGSATVTDNEAGIEGQTMDDDSNGAETATADVTINGNTSIGSTVDAEESWLIRDDVTNQTFNVVAFQVEQGSAAGMYTLSEMKLFPGRSYTVLEYNSNPDVNAGNPVFTYSEFVCFATDTRIATPSGERPVQSLRSGDMVLTLDHGPQPLVWTAARVLKFTAAPHPQKPIEFKPGSLGPGLPSQNLKLSPQHRILLAEGQSQHLGPAKAFTDRPRIRQMKGIRQIRYHSLMTARHEVLFANGVCVESFYPGHQAMRVLDWQQRFQLLALYPKLLDDGPAAYGRPARDFLNRRAICESNSAAVASPEYRQKFESFDGKIPAQRTLH